MINIGPSHKIESDFTEFINFKYFRGNSLKKQIHPNPTIKVSRVPARPDSLSLELYDDKPTSKEECSDEGCASNIRKVPSAVLPDEITKELEALSVVNEERSDRIAKLEKLRRGEEVLPEDNDEDNEGAGANEVENSKSNSGVAGAVALPESAESSVEGKTFLLSEKKVLEVRECSE